MTNYTTRLDSILAHRYRLEGEIGSGGMATVYVADDLKHGRRVAVKVLRPELAASLGAERFLREIEIAAQLLHPHILTLIDAGQDDELLFYVMPFVEGETLRHRLERSGELPLQEGLRILREIADALAYAHQRGIVHRDIKPENVLLLGRHALVADFGIAKAVKAAADTPSLTSTGVALGTPLYMAPEQVFSDSNVDHRADIYTFGVLAYEILAGVPPFSGTNAQFVMAEHLTRAPEPLSKLRSSISPGLEHLVMRCLEKRAADRWQSADELLSRLDDLVTSDGTAPYQGTKPSEPVDRTFRLTEAVIRKLNRATLDPRIIGESLHYLDNQVESNVLIFFIHGTGWDQSQFERHLQLAPYRALAPTLYGFEVETPRRIPLSLDDHTRIIREFMRDAIGRLRPSVSILVGCSSGADVGFVLLGLDDAESPMRLDGFLSLGCNLSLETCFVTRLFARMTGEDSREMVRDLQSLGANADTLGDWLNVHEYFVRTLRKFHRDLAPVRRFGSDIVRPFEAGGEDVFAEWYRTASERVRRLRCVFEESDANMKALRGIRLRNLDESILGEHFREDSILTEPNIDHFDLLHAERVLRYVDEMVGSIRGG